MKFLLAQDHMGLGISKRYSSYSFNLMSVKLYEDIGLLRLLLLGNRPRFLKHLWHFEILTWESMGKLKMWNISKTANSRAKRTKIWDSGSYSAFMQGTFDAQFLEFGSFGALCKISNFTNFKTLLLSQFASDSFKLYTMYHNHTDCQFFCQKRVTSFRQIGDRPKIAKFLWHSLSRTICCYIFKVLFLPPFSLESIPTLGQQWLSW